jgi:hypothetical protein
MRLLESAAAPPGSQEMTLPAGVEELLVDIVADGFALHCCGPKAAPNALVASYEWADWVDLLTVRNFDRVITALLKLVHPDHPDAPTIGFPAPAGLRVLRTQQRPMTIQLPTPGRARVRAARLATAMRTPSSDHALGVAVPTGTEQDHQPTQGSECSMLAGSSPGVRGPWRDIDGTHIALFCQVKQVADSTTPTALPSRLHQHGQVVGRGLECVYVCFPGKSGDQPTAGVGSRAGHRARQ